jgi:hypothetical protein
MTMLRSLTNEDKAKKFGTSLNLASLRGTSTTDLLEKKKMRLKGLLQKQYIAKYGGNSTINQAIKTAIHDHISRLHDVAEISQATNSGELDNLVLHAVKSAKMKLSVQKENTEQQNTNESSKPERNLEINQNFNSQQKTEVNVNQFALLAAMEKLAEDSKREKEFVDKLNKSKQLKRDLDNQTFEHKLKAEESRKEKQILLKQSYE